MKRYFLVCLICFFGAMKGQGLKGSFDKIAQNYEMMGGSLVIFDDKSVLESVVYGTADLDRNIAVSKQTKYRIASISKMITAVAVMQLVEKGQLKLDQDVSEILGFSLRHPSFMTEKITARMLLSHTSSIIDGVSYDDFLQHTVQDLTTPEIKEILLTEGKFYDNSTFLNKKPGSFFFYSNLNYGILGTLVERVSGMRFDLYCQKNIFLPLKLDVSYNVNLLRDKDLLAVIYRKPNGIWTPQTDNLRGKPLEVVNLEGYVIGSNATKWGPQGGLRCSAEDMAMIFRDFFSKKSTLLQQKTKADMIKLQWLSNGENGDTYDGLFESWGLGVHRLLTHHFGSNTEGMLLGHSGEAYGLVSNAYFDPVAKKGYVFITNGIGMSYQTDKTTGFYTLEKEVLEMVKNHFKNQQKR